MALKNRTSKGSNTFNKIQKLLAQNGANKVMFDYNRNGTVDAITFALDVDGKTMGFRLPAMVGNVAQILYGDLIEKFPDRKEKYLEQSYKTAWANIRDWIDAQLALVATRQVKIQHVFLPYMIMKGGKTLAEVIETNPSFLLESKN